MRTQEQPRDGREHHAEPASVHVSFVVPARNESANIGNCITSIKASVPPGYSYEILVGDHGSKDDTAAIALENGAIVIAGPPSTVGALRNLIASRARGDVLVFLDADVTLTPEWQAHIGTVLEDLRIHPTQIAGSMCDPPESGNYFLRYWFRKMQKSTSSYLGTGHMLIPRSHFTALQGFNATLVSGEDYDICMRSRATGGAINIVPGLKVIHHDYPESVREFVARETWHGAGDFQTFANLASSKIAQAAVVFAGLHVVVVIGLLWEISLAAGALALLALLLLSGSCMKFKRLSAAERMHNVMIFYLYLAGRAASALFALRRARSA